VRFKCSSIATLNEAIRVPNTPALCKREKDKTIPLRIWALEICQAAVKPMACHLEHPTHYTTSVNIHYYYEIIIDCSVLMY